MSWSTRELADLAGTTVNTVRHYHALGILDTPERRYNGYKQYRVSHLVRLIRVRRLAELGLPLSRVAEGDTDATADLRQVDAEMRAAIERFDAARADIAAILRESAPIDSPRGFESFAARLSEADRSMIHIYSRLVDEREMARLKRIVMRELDSISGEFTTLSADADESTRQLLAEKIADGGANWRSADAAWLSDDAVHVGRRMQVVQQTLSAALVELYSSAQRDVLRRASTAVLGGDRIAS